MNILKNTNTSIDNYYSNSETNVKVVKLEL